jgi:hypothetical protein
MPEQFKVGNYTPYGYIQNPYHRVKHSSGHLRSDEQLNGLGYFYPWYDKKPNYKATLSVTARTPLKRAFGMGTAEGTSEEDAINAVLVTTEDFRRNGIERSSPVHTKSRLRLQWSTEPANGGVAYERYRPVATATTTAEYWQVSEDILALEIKIATSTQYTQIRSTSYSIRDATTSSSSTQFDLLVSLEKGQGDVAGVYDGDRQMICLESGGTAVGLVPLLHNTSTVVAGHAFFNDSAAACAGLVNGWDSNASNYVGGGGVAIGSLTINASLLQLSKSANASSQSGVNAMSLFGMVRANSCAAAVAMVPLQDAPGASAPSSPEAVIDGDADVDGSSNDLLTPSEVLNQRALHVEADNAFWQSGGPALSGSWPDPWQHGVVYDMNTVRLNLRYWYYIVAIQCGVGRGGNAILQYGTARSRCTVWQGHNCMT